MTEDVVNPPAFPRAASWDHRDAAVFDFGECGMSLRDYFAGQALPSIIVATSSGQHMPRLMYEDEEVLHAIARDAYDMADAMLKAREPANG